MKPEHWLIVQKILKKYPYAFYAFGSRAKGTAKTLSDLDLTSKDPIPWHIAMEIAGDFEDSDLPFTVDFLDWDLCSEDFKKRISPDLILLV